MCRVYVQCRFCTIRHGSSASSCHARRHPAIPPSPLALVRPAQARFAMAPGPRRLSRMAVGNNVAANASGGIAGELLRDCEKVSPREPLAGGTEDLPFEASGGARFSHLRPSV